jgi:hypothetical protein
MEGEEVGMYLPQRLASITALLMLYLLMNSQAR